MANGSTPASSASSCSSRAHRPWKVVTAGSSEAGRPSRSSIRSRSASAAGVSTRMLSAAHGRVGPLGQPGEALDERGRLAGAGAADDEQRSAAVLDGFVLGGGEHFGN